MLSVESSLGYLLWVFICLENYSFIDRNLDWCVINLLRDLLKSSLSCISLWRGNILNSLTESSVFSFNISLYKCIYESEHVYMLSMEITQTQTHTDGQTEEQIDYFCRDQYLS